MPETFCSSRAHATDFVWRTGKPHFPSWVTRDYFSTALQVEPVLQFGKVSGSPVLVADAGAFSDPPCTQMLACLAPVLGGLLVASGARWLRHLRERGHV